MTPRHILLAGGLAVSAWLALFAERSAPDTVTQAVVQPAARPAAVRREPRERRASRIDAAAKEKTVDLLLDREQLIGGARAGSGAARLFGSQSWTPPPPPPPPPAPPAPPSAPPLPYQFLGKKLEDNVWEVYLGRDEHTFIVREQATIEGNYRVESIRPPTMTVTYLPLNQTQTLSIGGVQ